MSVDVHVVLVVHITHMRTLRWRHAILQVVLLWYPTLALQISALPCTLLAHFSSMILKHKHENAVTCVFSEIAVFRFCNSPKGAVTIHPVVTWGLLPSLSQHMLSFAVTRPCAHLQQWA